MMKKYLKGIPKKIVSVLAPLTKLRSFMEEETESIAPDDEAADGNQEIASLFEQTVLLVGQVFNLVAYQRRFNVLNTLIENNFKVKEILKDPIFTGLQRKPKMMNQFFNPVNQSFRQDPLPNSQQRGRGTRLLI